MSQSPALHPTPPIPSPGPDAACRWRRQRGQEADCRGAPPFKPALHFERGRVQVLNKGRDVVRGPGDLSTLVPFKGANPPFPSEHGMDRWGENAREAGCGCVCVCVCYSALLYVSVSDAMSLSGYLRTMSLSACMPPTPISGCLCLHTQGHLALRNKPSAQPPLSLQTPARLAP